MARDFVGSSNDYVEVGDIASLDLTGDTVALSIWVMMFGNGDEGKVLAKWADSGSRFSYLLSIDNDQIPLFAVYTGGTTIAKGTTDIDDGNWHHIAGTYDGSDARIYVDGVEENSTSDTGNMVSNTAPVRIGAGSGGSGIENPFTGDLGHAVIWDDSLSTDEIKSLSEGISPPKIREGNNLLFYAPLNGQDPEYDVIGGLDLTVNGSTKTEEPPIPNSIVAP